MQIPSVLPPPTRYKRAVETYNHWGMISPGCSGDGNTTSGKLSTLLMALEMVTWEVSNTNQGFLPYVFLQVKHGDLHADEYSQTWRAMMQDT